MRKFLFAIFCALFISATCFAQKQIFESPKMKAIIATHKIVAILPFNVSITYKHPPKNYTAESNHQQELEESKSIQVSMYTYLLRKSKDFTVEFQDVEKTNILLKKAGIYDKLDQTTKDTIAKVLGVDAVISGDFKTEQTKSEAAAITLVVLTSGFGGKTGAGTLVMNIHNGADGDLLWRFTKTMDEGLGRSSDELVEHMMRKVSRNFPYTK
ncbi:MAG TPA: hypothetical protein VGM63_05635 [Mucilaginibacter sp.]|jgi:hypothetical protein